MSVKRSATLAMLAIFAAYMELTLAITSATSTAYPGVLNANEHIQMNTHMSHPSPGQQQITKYRAESRPNLHSSTRSAVRRGFSLFDGRGHLAFIGTRAKTSPRYRDYGECTATEPSVAVDRRTALHMSSTPQRSFSSSRGNKRTPSRNRGANAANHNRRGHSFRLENKDGSARQKHKKSGNTKRAPRWEREGDLLYAEVNKQLDAYNRGVDENVSEHLLALTNERIASAQDVCTLLQPWTATDEELEEMTRKRNRANQQSQNNGDGTSEKEKKKGQSSPPFLWGSLPVGPVLASRLRASERSEPTSVQRAAFPILTAGHSKGNKSVPTKRSNAIIASPTGTGKTLAYLLPLLCTSPGGQSGEGAGGVLIVTPTIELACQIQREVDVLWPPSENKEPGRSSLFVVGAGDDFDDDSEDGETIEEGEAFPPGRLILRSIHRAPLIAGTPKMLRMLYREAGRIARERNGDDPTITEEERATSLALLSNLRTIVLDEADRLLRTEAVARETTERRNRKIAQQKREEAEAYAMDNYIPPPPPPKKKRLIIARQTQTEFLLRDIPIPSLDDVQIICASATIGRTMRRQLMQILEKPSADAAAELVTGEEDMRVKSKDAEKRKSVLLPEKLKHAYRVVNEGDKSWMSSNMPEITQGLSEAEMNEEERVRGTICALWNAMVSLPVSKPVIIFPGRVGVDRIYKELVARGLSDVRTLRNLDGKSPEAEPRADDSVADVLIGEDRQWATIPVYIIGERFARGLDLPDVEYVFMLSPPSSAAGYAHMAGRTGRSGRDGTAITLVRPKNNEVQRLAAIAEALGLKFASTLSGVEGGEEVYQSDEQDEGSSYPWQHLSESQLEKKKNAELYEYLLKTAPAENKQSFNKRSKKAELVSAIHHLHQHATETS